MTLLTAPDDPAPFDGAPPRVLIIEDDNPTRRALYCALATRGYQPIEASSGREGLCEFFGQWPDVVLLDLGLPDIDGIELVKRIRTSSGVPVIVVSARHHEVDQIAVLDAGADDFITKPFRSGELLARIRAALRHSARNAASARKDVLTINGLSIDRPRCAVSVDGAPIALTPTEYRLLSFMAEHAGAVVSHRQLLNGVWGPAYASEVEYLRVYMRRLRLKLEGSGGRRYFVTVPRVGYLFIAARSAQGARDPV